MKQTLLLCVWVLISILISHPILAQDFGCTAGFYQFFNNNPSPDDILTQFNPVSGNFEQIGGAMPFEHTALGYNTEDDYIYAMAVNNLWRIDANGNATSLGTVPGLPLLNAGDFDANGNFILQGSNQVLYIVDVDVMPLAFTTINMSVNPGGIADIVYDPITDRFYGVGNNGRIYTINRNTGATTSVVVTGGGTGGYGGAFADKFGNLYFFNNNNGRIYQIDPMTGVATQAYISTPSGSNDAASCPLACPPIFGAVPSGAGCEPLNVAYTFTVDDSPVTIGVPKYIWTGPDGFASTDLVPTFTPTSTSASGEYCLVTYNDTNGNDMLDADECASDPICVTLIFDATDSDGDGIFNPCDLDDDNDGILDAVECGVLDYATFTKTAEDLSTLVDVANGDYTFTDGTTGTWSLTTTSPQAQTPEADFPINGNDPLEGYEANGTSLFIRTDGTPFYAVTTTLDLTDEPGFVSLSPGGCCVFGFREFTLSWTGDGSATISDPNNELDVADGALISSGTTITDIRPLNPNLNADDDFAWSVQFPFGATQIIFTTDQGGNVIEALEYTISKCPDTDMDGIADYLDLDSDDDGCFDALEGDGGLDYGDLAADLSLGTTVDADGIPTSAGAGQGVGTSIDASQSDFCDPCENNLHPNYDPTDTDGDLIEDICDLDSDNDGILDATECNSINATFIETSEDLTTFVDVASGTYAFADGTNGTWDLSTSSPTTINNGGNPYTPANFPVSSALGYAPNGTDLFVYVNGSPFFVAVTTLNLAGEPGWVTFEPEGTQIWGFREYTFTWTGGGLATLNDPDGQLDIADGSLIPSGTTINDLTSLSPNQPADNFTWSIEFPFGTNQIVFTSDQGGNAVEPFKYTISKCPDTDMDGIADYLDLDSDNDGCYDAIEGGASFDYPDLVANNSLDNDGSSVDADGIPTAAGSPQTAGTSTDAATQATECDVCENPNHPDYDATDTDGDMVVDICDLDDDNDGILDTDEMDCTTELDFSSISNASTDFTNQAINSFMDMSATHAGNETISNRPIGNNSSEIGFGVNASAGENSEYTITFTEPLDITLEQASTAISGRFDLGDKWTITSTGGLLLVNSPSITDGLIIGGTGPELINITGNGTNTVSFDVNVEGGQISQANSEWFIEGKGITGLVIRFEGNTGITGSQFSLIKITADCLPIDSDGDLIADHLDLDSDNDGCFDAIEGGGSFDYPDLVANNSLDNDGSSVDADGIPTAAGSPQTVGTSTDAATQATECDVCTNVNHPNYMALNPSITVTETSGTTDNDGTICVGDMATLDAGAYTAYAWSTTETSQTISVSAAGTYTVTVTDANNCTATAETTITVNPLPTPSISVTETSGSTDNDGIICTGDQATLDAGSYDSYAWSTTETTQAIDVTAGGTYTVTVTDGNGCEAEASFTITENALPTPSISVTETSGAANDDAVICAGDQATLDAGTHSSYLWSTTETSQTITVSATGTYTVTVTDANGCESTAEAIITEDLVCDPCSPGHPGYDPTDTDNDSVVDICDLDDDNDGILDAVECMPSTGTMAIGTPNSGTIAYADGTSGTWSLSATYTEYGGGANASSIDSEGVNGNGHYWVQFTGDHFNNGGYDVEFTFSLAGPDAWITFLPNMGTGSNLQNNLIDFTISWTGAGNAILNDPDNQLSLADGTAISNGTSFNQRQGGTPNTNLTWSIQLPYGASDVTINAANEGSILEGFAFFVENCPDTDMDGTPDVRDTNSDNDSCPDAIEGGGLLDETDLASVTATSALSLPIDADGIPVSAGAGQGIGDSQNAAALDADCIDPLPVELLSFDGIATKDGSLLEWVTASEIDNEYFSVQRSRNGVDFEEIGTVDGAGNSTEEIHYDFLDRNPFFGRNYYRLQQFDYDGAFEYSNIIVLEYEKKGSFTLFPNPTRSTINLVINSISERERVQINVFDVLGQLLLQKNVELLEDSNTIDLDVSSFPTGTYEVVLTDGETISVEKFVKSK